MGGCPRGRSLGQPADPHRPGVAVFLFADIRGYTHFTTVRGAEAAAELAGRFTHLTAEVVRAHHGRVRGTWGDEVLADFASARDAVRAAVALQQECGDATLADPGLPLGIGVGIDVGEPADSDVATAGGVLNLAARLCARAQAGQILVSTELVHLAGAVDSVTYQHLGKAPLKGVGRVPVVLVRPTVVDRQRQAKLASLMVAAAERHRARRRRALVAGIIAAAVIVGGGVWWGTRGNDQLPVVPANSVGLIDTGSGQLLAAVPVGQSPAGVAAAGSSDLWVANTGAGSVSRIDQQTQTVTQTVPVGAGPVALTVLGQDVWVVNSLSATVSQVSTQTNTVVAMVEVGSEPSAITAGFGWLWVTNQGDATITRIDPKGIRPTVTVPVGDSPDGITTGDGAVWVSNRVDNTVSRVDPTHLAVGSPIHVGAGPGALVAAASGVWVANSLDLTVSRIDPRTGFVTTARVGDTPTAIAADAGSVWVADAGDATVARIDPGTGQVTRLLVGGSPRGLALVGSSLWVTAQGFPSAAHRGGTLTIANDGMGFSFDSIDPAVAYDGSSWAALSMVYDALVGYNRAPGAANYELVPDLAQTLPTPTDGGLTYTFTLRPGIRYSNGTLLKASDLRRGIERGFSTDAVNNGDPLYLSGIEGADACVLHPGPCDLSRGIEVDDPAGTVIFHLTGPDPDFLDKLAMHWASPAPPSSPPHDVGIDPLPGTGPYMISQYVPPQSAPAALTLVRNPYFHQWSSAAQPAGYPDVIRYVPEPSSAAALSAVEHGQADVAVPPYSDLAALRRNYPGQLKADPSIESSFIVLDTHRPPFNTLAARQAVAYALDQERSAIAGDLGQLDPSKTPCRLVPAGYPGSSSGCPYPYDPVKVQALAAHSASYHGPVNLYFFPDPPWRIVGPDIKRILQTLGYNPTIVYKTPPAPPYLPGTPMNVAGFSWYPDYPTASQYYDPLASCSALPSTSANWSAYCNPGIEAAAKEAKLTQPTDPGKASRLWKTVYTRLDQTAAVIPIYANTDAALLSTRVGNYQPRALFLLPDFDQLWVD